MTLTEVFVNQKRMNLCEHTVKMVPQDSFEKELPEGGMEGMEGKRNGVMGLYLEDRMN